MNDIINQMINPNSPDASPQEKPLKAPPREEASKEEKDDIIKQMALSPTSNDEDNTVSEVSKTKDEKKLDKEMEKQSAEDIVSLVLSGKTVGKKYREKLIDQATKDPNSVSMKVGNKWKTVRKAMKDGDLGEMPQGPDMDKLLAKLDPEMKAKVMSMLNPKTTNASPEQLAGMGFQKGMGNDFLPENAPQPEGGMPIPPQAAAGGMPPVPGMNPDEQLPPELLAAAGQGGVS